ncbi:MAG TPA: flavodoxin family protein, partial [Candidatus Latescibacteria bacterium]|nr:flavodoxin family protein [Candidatus Latescibacterota bacterium]
MAKLLIIYYSRSGNTEKMARLVSEGAKEVEGVDVEVKKVGETDIDDLLEADGIIVGSPT